MTKTTIVLLVAATLIGLGLPGVAPAGTAAARFGDHTNHSGTIPSGSGSVRIQGLPAALVGTFVPCPILFHGGGVIATGSPTVRINGVPAVRTGSVIPESGTSSTVIGGAVTVQIQ